MSRSRATRGPYLAGLCLLLAAFFVLAAPEKPRAAAPVLVLEIRDAIGPATSHFFLKGLQEAETSGASLLVLQLDTPGGLDASMRSMISAILGSRIPVAVYVSPSGARAASAGTYLLYASHIAAMAPATNVGAATPVQLGGGNERSPQPDAEKKPDSGQPSTTSMERKAINDSVAYLRGLAELRGRSVEFAEAAVREAASLTADAALAGDVIDVLAKDLPDLLKQVNGRSITTSAGSVTLAVADAPIVHFSADWRTKLLSVLTNPNVAYFLLLAGIYGLLLEGYNPGAIVPGVVGAVSLVLALYALQILSVNYAGLALIVLGIALIVGEAFAPSFGALGIGGIAAFVIGSVILFDADVPGFQVARGLIGGIALGAAMLMLLMAVLFMRSRRRPALGGAEQLLQETAVALEDFTDTGFVTVHGETWRAQSSVPIRKDQRLRVLRVTGLTLEVSPLD